MNRILFNANERYFYRWGWRGGIQCSHSYHWISAASLRRINELITSGGVDDFIIEIESPPALPAHLARFAFLEVPA